MAQGIEPHFASSIRLVLTHALLTYTAYQASLISTSLNLRSPCQMSTVTASPSALAASIPRAVFSFGTQKYTAIQTAGPNQAVIGKATITAGGQALQLNGGYASLATNGLVYKAGSIQSTTSTSSASSSVVTGGRVVLTLASTTLTAVALSDGSIAGSETIGASSFDWVVGQQTLTPVSDGIVVESGTVKETYTYQLTNITEGADVTRTTLTSSATTPLSTTTKESASLSSLEATSSPTTHTAEQTTSSAVASTVTETTTVTATPSDSSASPRGIKLAWMAITSLLLSLLADQQYTL